MIPKTILYEHNKTEEFDLEKFKSFVSSYGEYNEDIMMKELEECSKYPVLHISRLVHCACKSLIKNEDAKKCYEENKVPVEGFERLRRITGYLVGTLDRWNDGKKAEEKERVKHNVEGQYTLKEKALIEQEKREQLNELQNSCLQNEQ